MTILAVDLDEVTITYLRSNAVLVEVITSDDLDSLADYRDVHDTVLINTDEQGLLVCRDLIEKNINMSVIGLTYFTESFSEDRALFLENGGDDFLKAPPNLRELLATIKACGRRRKFTARTPIHTYLYENFVVRHDTYALSITIDNERLPLTTSEYAFISCLMENVGRPVSKETIYAALYPLDSGVEMKIIDVFAVKIRNKLTEVHPDLRAIISTVWGRGYSFIGVRKIYSDVA